MQQKNIHKDITFSRSSIGSYYDGNGILRYARSGVPISLYDPITGINGGLLIEPQTTFIEMFDSQLDNPFWRKIFSTITRNAYVSPDGSVVAGKMCETTDNNEHTIDRAVSAASNTVHTVYCDVIPGERTTFRICAANTDWSGFVYAIFNLSSGAVIYSTVSVASIKKLSNGQYRCSIQYTTGVSQNAFIIRVGLIKNGYMSYAGDGNSGLYISRIKVHTGAGPVSPITTGWETTSATSNGISTGSKTFAVGYNSTIAGQSIPAGATVRVWQTSNPSNYLTGSVTSHSGTTLTLNITESGGSDTGITDWTIQAGASVTRAADVCSVDLTKLLDAAGNPLWTGDEWTLVIDCVVRPSLTYQRLFSVGADSGNEVRPLITSAGYIIANSFVSGSSSFTQQYSKSIFNKPTRAVFAAAKDNFRMSVNGELQPLVSSCSFPSNANALRLFDSIGSPYPTSATIAMLQLYNRRIADAYLPILSKI